MNIPGASFGTRFDCLWAPLLFQEPAQEYMLLSFYSPRFSQDRLVPSQFLLSNSPSKALCKTATPKIPSPSQQKLASQATFSSHKRLSILSLLPLQPLPQEKPPKNISLCLSSGSSPQLKDLSLKISHLSQNWIRSPLYPFGLLSKLNPSKNISKTQQQNHPLTSPENISSPLCKNFPSKKDLSPPPPNGLQLS